MPIHGLGAYVIFFAFLAVVFTPFVLIAWIAERWPLRPDSEKHPEQWEQLSENQWRKRT